MQESPFYEIVLQRGITQGIVRGARETTIKNILTVLDTRFAESDTRPAATALEAIRDRERLDQLLNTALVSRYIQRLFASIAPIAPHIS